MQKATRHIYRTQRTWNLSNTVHVVAKQPRENLPRQTEYLHVLQTGQTEKALRDFQLTV